MHGTGIYHPLFASHPRLSVNTAMTDRVEILRPTGEEPVWTPGDDGGTMEDNAFELVYRGYARLQPDISWRARDRNFANELTGTAAVFMQLPIFGNELRVDKALPMLSKDYRITVIDVEDENLGWMTTTPLTVRNAAEAKQKWLRSFVCDIGTRATNGAA